MPVPVLERARDEMFSIDGSGMSVMEISHRSATFEHILHKAEKGIRNLLAVPNHYRILFLQGGATLQFSMIPMNFAGKLQKGEYVVTGAWGRKAFEEASKVGRAETIFSSESTGFRSIPPQGGTLASTDAAYIHYTSNETIHGVQFHHELDGGTTPVVCDMSSDIMSKPINVENFAVIYAGAQKNIGPSGVTVSIVRDNMLELVPANLPSVLDYRNIAKNDSMVNTPNTWGIYLIGLVCEWLSQQGGVAEMDIKSRQKAGMIYDLIDGSGGFYIGHANTAARSLMNVTFRICDEELEDRFCREAALEGLVGLAGHRSVGGIRASLYNAFPVEGAAALVDFMMEFSRKNG